MSSHKQTEEYFEKWLMSLSQDRLCYLDEESAWCGWQAAIDSIVVKLPEWEKKLQGECPLNKEKGEKE